MTNEDTVTSYVLQEKPPDWLLSDVHIATNVLNDDDDDDDDDDGNNNNIQESRALARKPRDAAAILSLQIGKRRIFIRNRTKRIVITSMHG